MDIKKVAANTSTDIEMDASPAVKRWLDKKSRTFQILLEKGSIKIKGKSKTLMPSGAFEEAYLIVQSNRVSVLQKHFSE